MEKQNFAAIKAVSLICLLLSVLAIILACVMPRLIVLSLYKKNSPLIDSAIRSAIEGDNAAAHKNAGSLVKSLNGYRDLLMLFYDHNAVAALTGAAETAARLSETDDKAQLVCELREIERAFESLLLTDEISLKSVF